jgi:hypothetical protein
MNIRLCTFFIFVLSCSQPLLAKSGLGEYYYGFGYSVVDGSGDLERKGNFLRLSAHGLNDSASDLSAYVDYGSVDSNGTDGTSWNLGVNYLVHYEDLTGPNSRLHPFVGLGFSYLDEETPIRLKEDGFLWSLFLGSELKITNSLSAFLGGTFYGLWSEFGTNDLTIDSGLTWWIDNEHGVLFEYAHSLDAKLNQFTIKYLYCWQ